MNEGATEQGETTAAISPESPEARRHGGGSGFHGRMTDLGLPERFFVVFKRVVVGTYTDGFTYAGNLAYLSLVTLFPFFIVAAALAQLFGRSSEGIRTLEAFLQTVPPDVADVLRKPVSDVLQARTGALLWLGGLVGLWTTAGFIETLRGILRDAYGTQSSTPFWRYRLGSIGLIVGAVILAMAAFSFQIILTAVEQFVYRVLPLSTQVQTLVSVGRFAPALALFGALYMLFYSLTPRRYRKSGCPKWPGPLFVTAWWMATTSLLPLVLSSLGGYDLTYGSLAGVMISLIFFYIIGLGVVIGAELNAALAEVPHDGVEEAREQEGGST
ncbi:YihY/virulence factor BrkB family protein [Sphingomonas sp. M1-B02]|uniref:YihY/virulence factor BrkB family protein n=1 Tax=Sphingomonas sp. M1-B02 TaxID=3114300 RepID=UPI0022404E25|nr:YihY/virulence factor BrkB family protein [Sphingomonas sp. S6-11]UZK65384.1 YihY/virulence factor BrkB family protein [Sphingomonas sp. S6-11]